MKQLRVAMIGCGRISDAYKPVFKELNHKVSVVYAVDTKSERAQDFAKSFAGCKVAMDYKEALTEEVDVVHIATPHYLHAEMAIEAMKKGKHVLVEKPMAIKLKDADAMIQSARDNRVKLGVIFQTRFSAGFAQIKKMIDNQELGKILGARSYLSWSRSDDYYQQSDWKGTWDKEGGGVLIDQAIHSIDRVQNLVGADVDWIEGTTGNRNHNIISVEDVAEAFIRFKNGCLYQLYACNCYEYDAPIQIEIVGEKGIAGLKQDKAWVQLKGQPYRELEWKQKGQQSDTPDYWGSNHFDQVAEFYEAVINNKKIQVDGEEGRKALEIVKGIYQSAKTRSRITLPFTE